MDSIFAKLRTVVAIVLAFGVSSLPSCSSMGGMRHLIDVPFISSQPTST